jgi:prephenate dehydrogenase
MRDLTEQMLPALKPKAIVTDVGSVKGSVVRSLEPLVLSAGAYYVGSHPMAGAEKTGVSAARADLFENAVCAITPTANSHPDSVSRLEDF